MEAIRDHFEDWVTEIDISSAAKQMDFEPTARFFTFNHTSTLQEVYEIEESAVFHVHGRAGKTEFLFGHGVQIIQEPEFDSESGESNRTMFSDAEGAAKSPLYGFKKQVDENIKKHRPYFASLRDISEVVVVGHSLNKVDLPYFQAIGSHATGSIIHNSSFGVGLAQIGFPHCRMTAVRRLRDKAYGDQRELDRSENPVLGATVKFA